MNGIKEAFIALVPDDGKMFQPELLRCDLDGVDIKFHSCFLKQAFQAAGLSDGEVANVDNGTFVGAGFEFLAETWSPGAEGCCLLHIRLGK
jgi:hypothetical protein